LIRRAALLALAACTCQAVPDVTYAVDDASVDVDPDVANTCPGQVPAFATICCGPIPCSGTTCIAACQDCVSRCTLAELCCPNAQARVTCRSSPLSCP
jgi:hypothetical protein